MTSQDHHAMLEQHNDAERERQDREALAILRGACKPWQFHFGEPPEDHSPLSSVFGAGITYTEQLLAKLLGISDFERGDGSENFDQDATQTLANILTAAKLYDPEDGAWAMLPAVEHSPAASGVSGQGVSDDVVGHVASALRFAGTQLGSLDDIATIVLDRADVALSTMRCETHAVREVMTEFPATGEWSEVQRAARLIAAGLGETGGGR